MTNFDLTPLLRSTIGFDRMTRLLDANLAGSDTASGYPPYNIVKLDEDSYGISMAVASFAEEDIEITAKENALLITGHKAEKTGDEETTYLHRGIAERDFERRFQLADYIRVTGAKLENGMLHISLVRELPERMKPRTIDIVSGDKLIEQKKSKKPKKKAA